MTVLFVNGNADGASPNVHVSKGGQHVLTATGDFDGATVEFQVRSGDDPNSEWVSNISYTESSNDPVTFLPNGYQGRGFISNVGASTDIFMEVRT